MIEAANGKKLPALDVFAKSLIYLKQEITGWLDKQIALPIRQIQWILTVPAIWSPGAKQMMREAAIQVCFVTLIVTKTSHTVFCKSAYHN